MLSRRRRGHEGEDRSLEEAAAGAGLRRAVGELYAGIDKDIAKLADILGHSSINTTRIYIMSTGVEHRRQLDRLGLVV